MYCTSTEDRKSLKEVVFSKYTEKEIFEHFMGIEVVIGKRIMNPLRQDNKAGCEFKISNGKIRFVDYSRDYWNGDCIDIVQKLYNCTFTEACFKIIGEMPFSDNVAIKLGNPYSPSFTPKERTRFTFAVRRWEKYDAQFWKQWPISKATLEKFFVAPCSWVRIGSMYININELNDPAYAYIYGNDEVKFYMPGREKKNRFRMNTTFPHGWLQLPKSGDLVIVSKSQKETMWLSQHMNIPSFGPQAEGHMPELNKILDAKRRFTNVLSFMDFERAGAHTMWRLRKEHDIPAIYLGTGKFNTVFEGAKDITDYSKMFGELKACRLVDKLINETIR